MRLAQREFRKGELIWVVGLGSDPVHVGCYASGPDNAPPGYTPFEAEQFGGGDRPRTLEEAGALFEELVRRRVADGWVEDERTTSIRCFHNPGRPEKAYWSIRLSYLWQSEVEVQYGPAGEPRPGASWYENHRVQRREFDDRESRQRWYAAEVARHRSEGYIELFRQTSNFADLGDDPAILAEDVDPGELTSDSYAEPGSPAAMWMEHHRRPSWKPETTEGDGPDTASKFSGRPWLADAEDWPACPTCQIPMQLLVQLNVATLPPEIGPSLGDGLIQFFACPDSDCEQKDENYGTPYPKNQVRRLIRPSGPGRAVIPDNLVPFLPRLITGWARQDDYPHSYEWRDLDDAEGETAPERGDLVDEEALSGQFPNLLGDKLAGWPHWIQGEEYPECELCGEQMRPVFQLDSCDHLPHRWGDNGVAHLTQCATHKDVLAFDWACG